MLQHIFFVDEIVHLSNLWFDEFVFFFCFAFPRYMSNLIVGCELYKTNAVDKAHDKLIRIWEWLDKFDNSDDTFYLSIREGLKYLTMSTLCHILYSVDRYECRKVITINLCFYQKYSS